jgi:hypothetical protein
MLAAYRQVNLNPSYTDIARSLQIHGRKLMNDGVSLRVVGINGDQANVQIQDLKA